ncbi:MAG: sensor histidine kinase [Solirubrobacteraceae bacterium]
MFVVPAAVPRARRRLAPVVRAWARARRLPFAFDAAFALLIALSTILAALGESHPSPGVSGVSAGQHIPPAAPAAYLLLAVAALALAWRRRRPVVVLAVSAAAVVAYTCLGYFNGAALLVPVIALYAVAVQVNTRRAVSLSLLTMAALMIASALFDPLGATGGGFILIPGEVAAALFLGLWVAARRAFTRRETEEGSRRAVDAERLRIARELHDVVAHTMATINVQAGVAAHVIDQQPGQATQALEAIRQASKEGLRELRGILNVLRQADEPDPTTPAPRLDQLDALIDGTRRAGLPTTLTVQGRPRALSSTVDLAAFRIVQESLTNALRYAGPTSATVTLSYLRDHLTVEILDSGQGPPDTETNVDASAHSGHGIPGMRERAQATGGTLVAGPGPERGFGVHARLPTHPS